MKAIVYRNFGSPDILKCEEIDKPAPGDNEVLIKVCAASLNPLDWKLMKGGPLLVRMLLGMGKPKVKRPGVDVAGRVEWPVEMSRNSNRAMRCSARALGRLPSMRLRNPRRAEIGVGTKTG